jgi:predicted nucleic acid-binding protein
VHVVDASVWVEFLRPSGSPRIRKELDPLIRAGAVALTEWTILELMVGIRGNESPSSLLNRLAPVHRLSLSGDGWIRAWDLAARLRKKAVTPSAADCLLATVALSHGVPLLHCDTDFELIAKHSKLQTLDWTNLL